MILTTHGVVGAGSAYLLTSNPFIALIVGFLSHFILDAMPHWEYSLSDDFKNLNFKRQQFWIDGLKISIDFLIGLILVFLFFQNFSEINLVIWFGFFGGLLPDAMQFIGFSEKFKFFVWFKRMHGKIHCQLDFLDKPFTGAIFQLILIIAFLL